MNAFRITFSCIIILCLGTMFFSCQKDGASIPDAQSFTPLLKSVTIPDCQSACLQAGPFIQETISDTVQWGPLSAFPDKYRNNKYFVANAWNDVDSFYISSEIFGYQYNQTGGKIKTLIGPTNNNYPFTDVIITLNAVTYNFSMDDPATPNITETATTFTKGFLLPAGWERCDAMVYTIRLEGDGHPVFLGTGLTPLYVTYNLYDNCTCESALTGSTECTPNFDPFSGEPVEFCIEIVEGNATITYCGTHLADFAYTSNIPGYAVISGNLLDINTLGISYSAGDLWTNPAPGGNTVTFEGEVVTCQEYSFLVMWYSDIFIGDITGTWTAVLYTDATKTTVLSTVTQAPMGCDVP